MIAYRWTYDGMERSSRGDYVDIQDAEKEIAALRARVAELEEAFCVVASDGEYAALWVPHKVATISWPFMDGRKCKTRKVEVLLNGPEES